MSERLFEGVLNLDVTVVYIRTLSIVWSCK